ncbi:MAG: hypothetical protein AAGI03_09575 [Pseudomonadota bacterium]
MKIAIATATTVLALLASPAQADEVWSSEIGMIVYEDDLYNGQAVLSYTLPEESDVNGKEVRGHAFVDDLALNYDDRSVHGGIWIEPETGGEPACATSVIDPRNNQPVSNWGRIEVIFLTDAFPSGFVVKRGFCFEDPWDVLVAEPVIG